MKGLFLKVVKFILFWGIVIFSGYIAFSQDPVVNGIIRLIGFIAIVYGIARVIYPEKMKSSEI